MGRGFFLESLFSLSTEGDGFPFFFGDKAGSGFTHPDFGTSGPPLGIFLILAIKMNLFVVADDCELPLGSDDEIK